jgi:hypothetical protein
VDPAYLQQRSFCDFGFPDSSVAALEELQSIMLDAATQFAAPLQFPDPAFSLDLASRAPDELRQFKHIHQMCLMHATHFERANQIKTIYLIDAYLWGVERLNPIAIYNGARSLLELHAMLKYVARLLDEARAGDKTDWRARGERYFGIILHARYGTTDPTKQTHLKSAGMEDAAVRPVRLQKARKLLSEELDWTEPHYAALCDFVHPNLSSQRISGAYAGKASTATSSKGGMLLLKTAGPIIQYQFPMPEPGRLAVLTTAERALANAKGMVHALNNFPRSPYLEEELAAWTGSPLGLLSPSASASNDNQHPRHKTDWKEKLKAKLGSLPDYGSKLTPKERADERRKARKHAKRRRK